MGHKYLEDICVKDNPPSEWCKGDKRESKWEVEREIYGFDSRETWSLDTTFFCWLYERLMMYNEINIVDTSHHKFEYDGQTITFQECIDRMLNGCKIYLTSSDWEFENKELRKLVEDVPEIFALCFWCLWW